MSDPVTNVEIEDVLSSIRRLVGEESRAESRDMQPEEEKKPTKLVLTPALRVADQDPAKPGADSEQTPDKALARKGNDPWSDPEATLYEAAQAAEAYGPDNDVFSDEDGDILGIDHIVFSKIQRESEVEAEPEPTLAKEETLAGDESLAEDEDLAKEEAGVEHLDEEQDATPEDLSHRAILEEPSHVPDVELAREEELTESEIDDRPVETETQSEDDVNPGEAATGLETDSQPQSLSSRIEALEAAIAQTEDQWEPDGQSDDAYSGTPVEAIEWQDHVPTDKADERAAEEPQTEQMAKATEPTFHSVREPQREAIDPEPQQAPEESSESDDDRLVLSADETIMDEESLRELVADIVREELQGALGERITRNVRKLVRREIHRALTAHELD